MKKVSDDYKSAMAQKIRNRSYMAVTLGVINAEAQEDARPSIDGTYAYWSNKSALFNSQQTYVDYATLENDYFKVDGSMVFLPKNSGLYQLQDAPLTTNALVDSIVFKFIDGGRNKHWYNGSTEIDKTVELSIKGITIDFGEYYPTEFTITTDAKEITYTNDSSTFTTSDVLGDTAQFKITPITMVGGNQRLRIESIQMGVGLTYTNNDISSSTFEEFVNGVSNETSYQNLSVEILDNNNVYNVDDDNSFINFLETGQDISVSYGMTLDNDSVEWIKKATLKLSDWKSERNKMTFSATDLLSTTEDEYSLGYKIYTRTAHDEAVSILQDLGLEPDEYVLDDCLKDISLTNPMPKATHKECLQLLCNASRCIFYQDEDGKIVIKANFANVIDPEDMSVTTNGKAWWSKAENVLYGGGNVYAELTRHFMRVDGQQLFLPKSSSTSVENTGYVTSLVSDENGLFTENPILTLKLPASYTYYGMYITFQGNPPKGMKIHTYSDDTLLNTYEYSNLSEKALLNDEFYNFDTIKFEITKAYPMNRVLIDKISFGDLSDYTITKDSMTEYPWGYAEKKTKDVYVKIYTFENDETSGEPKEVEDSVYLKRNINNAGDVKYCENQLISTQSHARAVAEWLGNYYSNNISYDVEFRGEPRIDSGDIVYMESDYVNNLQVEVEKHTISFGGKLSGSLSLRRAMRT